MIEGTLFAADFKKLCYGKKECSFDLANKKYLRSPTEVKYPRACNGATAQVYIQATCQLTPEEMMEQQYIGVTAIFICCIIAAIYFEAVKRNEGYTELDFKKWDLQTCTAADYTVRLNLPSEWYEAFLERQQQRVDEGKEKVDIVAFLRKIIEKDIVKLMPAIRKADLDEDNLEVKVASIQFAYMNG